MNTSRTLHALPRLLGITSVLAVILLAAPRLAEASKSSNGSDLVGTYLYDGAIEYGIPGLPPFLVDLEWAGLMSLHADGTVTIRHSFGPPGANIEPALGVWKKTGRNTIKVMYLFFIVPRLEPDVVAENFIQTGRVTMNLTVDRRTCLLEGDFVNEVFASTVDPLDPSQSPAVSVGGSISNARQVVLMPSR